MEVPKFDAHAVCLSTRQNFATKPEEECQELLLDLLNLNFTSPEAYSKLVKGYGKKIEFVLFCLSYESHIFIFFTGFSYLA